LTGREPTADVRENAENAGRETWLHGDAHVHVHSEHDPAVLFARAIEVARECGPLFLLLSEGFGRSYFRDLRAASADAPGGREIARLRRAGIVVEPTSERGALRLHSAGSGDPGAVILVAGRQVVSRERLEVLLLALDPDHPLSETPDRTRGLVSLVREGLEAGAVTVMPWGFGKWLGARARHVRAIVDLPDVHDHPLFFLGDIPARCWPWATPRAFGAGIRVLRGTDVLPLAGSETRVASYGFRVRGRLDPDAPCRALIACLSERTTVEPVGGRDSLIRTLVNQVRYRLRPRGTA